MNETLDRFVELTMDDSRAARIGEQLDPARQEELICLAQALQILPIATYQILVLLNNDLQRTFTELDDEGLFYKAHADIESNLYDAFREILNDSKDIPLIESKFSQANQRLINLRCNLNNFDLIIRPFFANNQGLPAASGFHSAAIPLFDILSNNVEPISEERFMLMPTSLLDTSPSYITREDLEIAKEIEIEPEVKKIILEFTYKFRGIHKTAAIKHVPGLQEGIEGTGYSSENSETSIDMLNRRQKETENHLIKLNNE